MRFLNGVVCTALFSGAMLLAGTSQVEAQQRSIINQGFEEFAPGYTPPRATVNPGYRISPDSNFIGWNSSGGESGGRKVIEVWGNEFSSVPSAQGDYFVELNPSSPIRMSQDICLVQNELLTYSYQHRARAGGEDVQIVEFSAVGTNGSGFSQVFDVSRAAEPKRNADGAWIRRSGTGVRFNGPTGVYSVGFESLNRGSYGNLLDDIQIVPIALTEFATEDAEGVETADGARPELVVSGLVQQDTLVTFEVIGGSATEGADYTVDTNTILIPQNNYDGASSNSRFGIPITVLNDQEVEAAETLTIRIVSVTNATNGQTSNTLQAGDIQCLGAPETSMTFTILDSEPEIDVATSNTDGPIAHEGTDAVGVQVAGEAQTITYTITNTGTDTLTLEQPTIIDGLNTPSDVKVSPLTVTELGKDEETTITVTFTPEFAGDFDFDLSIPNNDSNEAPYAIEVTVTAEGEPEIDVATSNTDGPIAHEGTDAVGVQVAGEAPTITYTITNTGTDTLTLQQPTIIDGLNTPGDVKVSPLTVTELGKDEETTITVTFTPEFAGDFDFDLSIPNNDSNEAPYAIEVTGTAEGEPEIAVVTSNGNHDIPHGETDGHGMRDAGQEQTVTYTITNTGTALLHLGMPEVVDGDNTLGDPTVSEPSARILGHNDTATFTATFTPEFEGPFSFAIFVPNDDVDEGPYQIIVAGAAAGDPEIAITSSVSGALIDGGIDDQGSPDEEAEVTITYTISNEGLADLILDGTPVMSDASNVVGGVGGILVTAPDAGVLAPGQTTTFDVTFTPDNEGDFSFEIDVLSNDADESPFDITVAGNAEGIIEVEKIEAILSENVRETTTLLSASASNIARRAADRLGRAHGPACGALINEVLAVNPINFASDSYVIAQSSAAVLDQVAQILTECGGSEFLIAGHTDSDGSAAYNDTLSQNRVDAVRDALAQRGIAVERLATKGFGESQPIASNATEAGKALNRRVEFIARNEANQAANACGADGHQSGALAASGSDAGASVSGGFAAGGHNCLNDGYSETWGTLSVAHSDDSGTTGMLTGGMLKERQNNGVLSGRFVEGYLSTTDVQTDDATGTITAVGLHAGLYGARETEGGLRLSYYGSAAVGHHSFEIDTGAVADGNYIYGGLFAGASVGGERAFDAVTLQPRVGVDVSYGAALGSKISGTDAELDIDPTTNARAFVSLGMIREVGEGELKITPQVFCDTSDGGACGFGAYVDFETSTPDKGDWDMSLGFDYANGRQTASLGVTRTRQILGDFGVSKSRVGASGQGALELSQTFDFAW